MFSAGVLMSNQGFTNAYMPSSGSPKTKGWLPEEDVLHTRTQVHGALSSILTFQCLHGKVMVVVTMEITISHAFCT